MPESLAEIIRRATDQHTKFVAHFTVYLNPSFTGDAHLLQVVKSLSDEILYPLMVFGEQAAPWVEQPLPEPPPATNFGPLTTSLANGVAVQAGRVREAVIKQIDIVRPVPRSATGTDAIEWLGMVAAHMAILRDMLPLVGVVPEKSILDQVRDSARETLAPLEALATSLAETAANIAQALAGGSSALADLAAWVRGSWPWLAGGAVILIGGGTALALSRRRA
ncbi:MAG: hypothetical protein HY719_00900 [Planctomycetes bacterium]|nr:hypothetical protein [Planctomycetota bacterium]